MKSNRANIKTDDDDEIRRRNEMNAFAAMANGNFNGSFDNEDTNSTGDEGGDGGGGDSSSPPRHSDSGNAATSTHHPKKSPRENDMNNAMPYRNVNSKNEDYDDIGTNGDVEAIKSNGEMNENQQLEDELRTNEMNAFAAMATAGVFDDDSPIVSGEGLGDEIKYDKDEGGGGDSVDKNGTFDFASEEIRRRNEMSTFAAMANGENPFLGGNEEGDSDGDSEDSEMMRRQSQQNEINAFALAASRSGSMMYDPKQISNANGTFSTSASTITQGMGSGESSGGTFVSSSTGSNANTSNSNQHQNLTAALASLDNDRERDPTGTGTDSNASLTQNAEMALPVFSNFQTTHRKPACDQIYSERILVPRPLFFGTVLPERVCAIFESLSASSEQDDHGSRHQQEQNVFVSIDNDNNGDDNDTCDEKKLDGRDSDSDEKNCDENGIDMQKNKHVHIMDPDEQSESQGSQNDNDMQYKNVSNAIEAFGNSSLTRCERKDTSRLNAKRFKSHISLIEPVWGDMARLNREDRILEKTEAIENGSIVCETDIPHNVSSLASPTSTDISETSEIEPGVCSPTNDQPISPEQGSNPGVESTNLPLSPNEGSVSSASSDLNENNLFLQYARGDSHGLAGTFIGAKGTLVSVPESDVLRNVPNPNGSFESSELKRQIGLNDNLSKALEMLTDSDGVTGSSAVSLGAVEAGEAASEAIHQMTETVKDGRPLSNFELTGGKVPLYSCDDNPLPSITDLFVHETKEDLIRSSEQQESEEIISSHTVPNVFGTTVCPSRCSGPDDGHSWFSRNGNEGRSSSSSPSDLDFLSTKLQSEPTVRSQHRVNMSFDSLPSVRAFQRSTLPSPLPPPPVKKTAMRRHSNSSRTFDSTIISDTIHQNTAMNDNMSAAASSLPPRFEAIERKRIPSKRKTRVGWWNMDESSDNKKSENSPSLTLSEKGATLQVPPTREEMRPSDFSSKMSPKLTELLESNRPLSALPAAVDTVKQLPSLSDRPPNNRYVQIDTHFVGFRSLGEVEPFFCGISLWHVKANAGADLDTCSDKNRCGRITETLFFDVVNDPIVQDLCKASIFPSLYATDEDHLQTTRCGVFPIPSCYSMNNIYAVIVVEKTLTGEDADLDIYYNNQKQKGDDIAQDLSKCRNRAGRAADRLGHFLTPFAFGVAPLVKIIGPRSPSVPSSMAAQIPLLKLRPGEGDCPIIEHIVAMNCPRGHPSMMKKTPEVANDGAAVMVLRNFGYLGIHSTMSRTSKLAKDRLVDFTGEVQVRRRQKGEKVVLPDDDNGQIAIVDHWQSDFIAEPTMNGGRISSTKEDPSIYTRELASVPLVTGRITSRSLKEYKPSIHFHTSFCNELLLYPRNISNCPKRNVTIKMEIARLRFCDDLNAMIVKLSDSCIHNTRRGPFLVQEVFTSCAYHKVDPAFINEFKVKLPLGDLSYKEEGELVAVFTAYHITVKGKKRWALKTLKDSDDIYAPLEQIGCGYLKLSTGEKASHLIQNGIHSVQLKYKLREVGGHEESGADSDRSYLDPNVRVLDPIVPPTDDVEILNNVSSASETPSNVPLHNSLWSNDNLSDIGENVTEESPDTTSNPPLSIIEKIDSPQFDGIWSKAKLFKEQKPKPVSLAESTLYVRTVSLSSIHSQNEALAEYFQYAPSIPRRLKNYEFGGIWKEGGNEIKKKIKYQQESLEFVSRQEKNLLQSIVGISKSTLCPPSELSAHFIRVIFPLWRVLVAGTGKPSIEFSNPSFSLPLRIHTFSTLLYVLNAVTSYLSKSGISEPGSSQGWSIMTTARLVAILFDEETILIEGDSAFEEECAGLFHSTGIDAKYDEAESNIVNDSKKGGKLSQELNGLDFVSPRSSSLKYSDTDLDFITVKSDGSQSPSQQLSPSSQDDSILLNRAEKPAPQRKRAFSAPQANPLKVDTKSDFQFALSAGANSPILSTLAPSGTIRRKWMTGGPLSSLATIAEDHDKIDDKVGKDVSAQHSLLSSTTGGNDALDTELVVNKSKPVKVKQMRVPKVNNTDTRDGGRDEEKNFTELDLNDDTNSIGSDSAQSSKSSKTVPNTDEIETAGEAFLDMIGKNYGYGLTKSKVLGGEERRVGVSHHRKTKSRCSIDWTLPPTDHIIESHQQLEIINRSSSLNTQVSSLKTENSTNDIGSIGEASATTTSSKDCNSAKSNSKESSAKNVPHVKPTCLPSYIERIAYQGRKMDQGRWFPFVYEVVIFQWNALLSEQTRKSSRKSNISSDIRINLSEASQKAKGVVISCAPVLFVVIKQSLAHRIDSLFRKQAGSRTGDETQKTFGINPLVTLDDGLLSTMESLITKVTDACIDSRNFDSWTFRSTSIAVNDSIIRFLRDLFALLDANVVHRLMLVYFSRFTSREGKKWEEHDSKIGLRCSWEVAKLRLNAITTLIRFQDQIKINKPLTESWGNWSLRPPTRSNRHLFSNAIEELESLGMEAFAAIDPMRKGLINIPQWKPHWLAELIMDVCIAATGHVEQSIQLRASSLLYELFWTSSNIGKLQGSSTVVASLYLSFIPKLLDHVAYLSRLPAKSPMRKDLLPCFVFVLQSAPFWLLRALWRKFCKRTEGKGTAGNYGGIRNLSGNEDDNSSKKKQNDEPSPIGGSSDDDDGNDEKRLPCILDLCSLLNLSLTTMEYEGSESHVDDSMSDNTVSQWHAEFLLSPEKKTTVTRRHDLRVASLESFRLPNTSTSSRKWYCHDGAIVIITTCRNIVREYVSMLRPTGDYDASGSANGPIASFSIGPGIQAMEKNRTQSKRGKFMNESINFSFEDKVIFLRAISSVYLNCLSLQQSDVVFIKTLLASTEILKVFGIDCFLSAVGETLQHWMRVLLVHCGARRAKVRVEALDFLALILRLQWDSFGSFTRVRIPLLAVQTEVMERIVATAAARYYREQRKEKITIQYLSNLKAEAALTPLWRTLQRLHDGSASNNAAFKSALQLLANRMKTLYKAYIAAHALAIVNRTKENGGSSTAAAIDETEFQIARVVMESAEFSKKILGNNHLALKRGPVVIQNETVEDAFLAAADVFSPTELPLHRVAWLRKLAEFHATRERNAEQAACRLQIYKTLRQAATLHEMLWNSIPFWPWASDPTDGTHVDGEGPVGINGLTDSGTDFDDQNQNTHTHMETERCESFRRIFYRVANSVKMRTGDWDIGRKKTLFYGACFASEYNAVTSWIALCEIESDMVDEAETAGELFLKAGIVESSRFCWSLATQFYSEVFNYARLAYCYRKLASVVASQVPTIETGHKHTSNHLEFSSPLGRFYRVHYHGGASDELMGKMFIYRAPVYVKLEEFCENLRQVFASILPEKTPISLSLDDGRVQEPQSRKPQRRQLGAVPREPMIIKVTPLKPLLSKDRCPRGSAEWFYRQTEIPILHEQKKRPVQSASSLMPRQNHNISRNRYSTISSHANGFGRPSDSNSSYSSHSKMEHEIIGGGEEIGVNKFSFTHDRNRQRAYRELHKIPAEMVTEKNLRVTELLVSKNMPNCVTRQPVAVENRTVFHQAPIEAGVEAVCSYCAILFRTAVATNGLAVIGDRDDHKIGTAAIKVIAECIHRSKVKELGLTMLKKVELDDNQNIGSYERLSEEETELHRVKLSRAIVIFLELLHVLIGRNRDLLLAANESKKRRDASSTGSYSARGGLQCGIPPSPGHFDGGTFFTDRTYDDGVSTMYGGGSTSSTIDRTDKAMAIQRELQISFIAMTKALHQVIRDVIHSETPRWMRMCAQDNHYFSSGAHRQTRIPIGEELLFFRHPSDMSYHDNHGQDPNESFGIPLSILPTQTASSEHGSYEESVTSRTHSRASSRDSPSATNYPNF